MSSAAVLKATGGVLTKERYHSLFKTFRAQSKGDFQANQTKYTHTY